MLEHLDYLGALGVTAICFNPIFKSAANHRYHTYDYYHVDPVLGGNDAPSALLEASHERGIRTVLDGVFNHARRGCYPFYHTLENGIDGSDLDWFHYDEDRLRWGEGPEAYPSPTTTQHAGQNHDSLHGFGYQAWWDLPVLPEFDTETVARRPFLFDVPAIGSSLALTVGGSMCRRKSMMTRSGKRFAVR